PRLYQSNTTLVFRCAFHIPAGDLSTLFASARGMAKYGKAARKRVKSAMHRKKKGTLKSGSGRKVKSRKQAIAIGLSEARKKGAKVPRRKSSRSRKRR